jgi:hypothetical protein
MGFCATDPASADVDFERNAGASTIVRVDDTPRP